MNRKLLFVFSSVAILAIGAVIVWSFQNTSVKSAKSVKTEAPILRGLSETDVQLILESQATVDAIRTLNVIDSVTTRKAFLDGMREYLALAAAARREGLHEDKNVAVLVVNKQNAILAELYRQWLLDLRQSNDVSQAQFDEFWANGAHESAFNAEVEAVKGVRQASAESTGNASAAMAEPTQETLDRNRKLWAATKILSDRARADSEFMSQPAIDLRMKVAEAGILAYNYLNKHWAEKIKATEVDVQTYLSSRPEYDIENKRKTAAAVLERVKKGEDFSALAAVFSEDRATKNSGGVYKDQVKGGAFWTNIQDSISTLKKGQLVDGLVETNDGFHIVQLLDRRTIKGADGKELEHFDIRHILLQRKFEEPGIRRPDVPPPFMTPVEIALVEVQKEKRKNFVDAAIVREQISMPEDFAFKITSRMQVAKESEAKMLKMISDSSANTKKGAK